MAVPPRLTVVWVYGTLKRGFANYHAVGLADTAALGAARTLTPFPLLTLSRFRIPFLLDAPDSGLPVTGELYAVEPDMLATLDKLEGHPEWYRRREIDVVMIEGGGRRKAQAYLLPPHLFRPELLKLPPAEFAQEYTLEAHKREYVPPPERPPGARDEIIAAVKRE